MFVVEEELRNVLAGHGGHPGLEREAGPQLSHLHLHHLVHDSPVEMLQGRLGPLISLPGLDFLQLDGDGLDGILGHVQLLPQVIHPTPGLGAVVHEPNLHLSLVQLHLEHLAPDTGDY